MITIINYGLGNVQAIANIYSRINIPVKIASQASELSQAEKIILPGVGAFDWAMTLLQQSGMKETLNDLILSKKKPILGICVGMQMMAIRSEEGMLPGLAWINAEVKKIRPQSPHQKIQLPHMGWNDVIPKNNCPIFRNIETPLFYFLHSYYFSPNIEENQIASTSYYEPFTCAVQAEHIFGVQFHPEKSHQAGILLLKNFAEL